MTASAIIEGGTASATRVATRRNADCSSARRADFNASRRDRAASSPTTTAVTRKTLMATRSPDPASCNVWIGGRKK